MQNTSGRRLVIVDSSLTDSSNILQLNPQTDGLSQIVAALSGLSDSSVVTISARTQPGSVQLGATVLSLATLNQYQAELSILGEALGDSGSILLDESAGAGTAGEDFLRALSQATGTPVQLAPSDVSDAETILSSLWETQLAQAQTLLRGFLTHSSFEADIRLAFGDNVDVARARSLIEEFTQSTASNLPEFKIVAGSAINHAQGAYATATDTIYLSAEFLHDNASNADAIRAVLLEELGHALDARLNASDTPGDEGELFSALVRNLPLDDTDIQRMKVEDDNINVVIENYEVVLEQSTHNLGSLFGFSYREDNLNAISKTDNWVFTLTDTGQAVNSIILIGKDQTAIIFSDIDLKLYNNITGTLERTSYNSGSSEKLSLEGLAAGEYRLNVYDFKDGSSWPSEFFAPPNYTADFIADYALGISAPSNTVQTKDLGLLHGLSTRIDTVSLTAQVWNGISMSGSSNLKDDWKFSIASPGKSGDGIALLPTSSNSNLVDLNLELYNSNNERIKWSENPLISGEAISLAGLDAGDYRVRVYDAGKGLGLYNAGGGTVSYKLGINAPLTPVTSGEVLSDGVYHFGGLSIAYQGDYGRFSFTVNHATTEANYVQAVVNGVGAIDLALWNENGLVRASVYTPNSYLSNGLSLANLNPGTYYIQAGSVGGINTTPSYDLYFNIPKPLTPDHYDQIQPNETRQTATVLGNAGVLSGYISDAHLSIHSSTDKDWYKFQLSQPGTSANYLAVSFDHNKGDIDIALYDTNGKLVESSTDTNTNVEFISLAGLQANKDYYLNVVGYQGEGNEYRLTIKAPGPTLTLRPDIFDESSTNNLRQTAVDLNSNSNGWAQGSGFHQWENLSIHNETDHDWFKFQLKTVGTYGNYAAIQIDGSYNNYKGDLDLELLDSSGVVLRHASGVRDLEKIDLNGLPQGTYFLHVLGYHIHTDLGEDIFNTNPEYTLMLNTPGSDAFEDNDTPAQVEVNNATKSLNRSTTTQTWDHLSIDDNDWYRFSLPSLGTNNDFVRIDFSHAQGDINLKLFRLGDATNAVRSSFGVTDRETISLNGLAAGDYYIEAFGHAGAKNPDYSLTVSAPLSNNVDWADKPVPNNDTDHATDLNALVQPGSDLIQIGMDPLRPLSIDNSSDEDFFRISLTTAGRRGDYATISFDHTAGDLDFYLVDHSYQVLRESTGVANQHTIDLSGLGAGDYYLLVAGYAGSTNSSYSLTVQAPLTTPATGDWAEGHTTRLNPFNLGTVDSSYSQGHLSIEAGSEDWFKFHINGTGGTGDSVGIHFDPSLGDLDIELWGGTGGSSLLGRSASFLGTESLSLNNLSAGDYYLKVSGATPNATHPDYTLFITPPKAMSGDWTEIDIRQSKGPHDLGTLIHSDAIWDDVSVSLSPLKYDIMDDWTFALAKPGAIGDYLSLSAFDFSASTNLDLGLYDANSVLVKTALTPDSSSEEISLENLAAGEYRLHVFDSLNGAGLVQQGGGTITYNLGFNLAFPVEDNNLFDLREVVGSQSWSSLSIDQASDLDWFKFTTLGTADASDYVEITFDQNQGDLDLYLYNATGTTQLGQSETTENSEKIKLVDADGNPLAAGTYQLLVKPYNTDPNNLKTTNPNYQLSIHAPDSNPADWAEGNDNQSTAKDLRVVEGLQTYSGLSVHQKGYYSFFAHQYIDGDPDWFSFSTVRLGNERNSVSIEFDHQQGDLQLYLYDKLGNKLSESASSGDREKISLENLPADQYFIKVAGAVNGLKTDSSPNYSLIIDAPQELKADFADTDAHNNDISDRAYDLRTVLGTLTVDGLSVHTSTDQDWFTFNLDQNAVTGEKLRIDFDHLDGELSLALYDANHQLLESSTTAGDFEQISLAGKTAGTYYAKVTGASGATNPAYSLTVVGRPELKADALEGNEGPFDFRDLKSLEQQILFRDNVPGAFMAGHQNSPENAAFAGMAPVGANLIGQTFPSVASAFSNPNSVTSALDQFPDIAQLLTPSQKARIQGLTGGNSSLINSGLSASYFPSQFNSAPNLSSQQQLQRLKIQLLQINAQLLAQQQLQQQAQPVSFYDTLNPYQKLLFITLTLAQKQGIGQESSAVISNLSIDKPTDQDWFKFELSRDGKEGESVGIRFDHLQGALKLELFESFNLSIPENQYASRLIESVSGSGDHAEISLAGLAKGSYFVRVTGELIDTNGDGVLDEQATHPNYSLILTAPPQADVGDDWAEAAGGNGTNDTALTAYDLREVDGGKLLSGLSIQHPLLQGQRVADQDWFRFTTQLAGQDGNKVRIDFDHASGDLDLALFEVNGNPVLDIYGHPLISKSTGDFEEISFKSDLLPSGLPAGTYFVQVTGYNGADNPHYSLSLYAPEATVAPDSLEPNNAIGSAFNLDLSGGVSTLNATIHPGDKDYYQFTTHATGTIGNSLGIQFEPGRGDLQLALYSDQNPNASIRTATGSGGNESLSLSGLPAGTYYAKVEGADASTANAYQLHIDAPTSLDTAQAQNDWTVLVYITASNLASFAFADINEMEKATAGLPGNVNFAVLWDQSSLGQTFATGGGTAWGDTGRAIIRADTNDDFVATPFERIGEKETNKPQTLVDFVQWGAAAAPAENYALVMWDHGGGSLYGFNVDDEGNSSSSAGRLYTSDLASALTSLKSSGINLDLISFDACLMANVEVCHTLRNQANVLVAAEESVAGGGFDYTTAFSTLGFDSEATASTLASGLVDSFHRENLGQREDTLSAIDISPRKTTQPSSFEKFVDALRVFSDSAIALTDTPTWNSIFQARTAATDFDMPFYCDFGQFLQNVRDSGVGSALKTAAGNAFDALQAVVIDRTNDPRQTQGLSIYLPENGSIDANYLSKNQDFLTETHWGSFLSAFLSRPSNRSSGFQEDWAEANDVAARAYNLHTLVGDGHVVSGLSLHDSADVDWFRFTIGHVGAAGDAVTVDYSPSNGQALKLSLYHYDPASLTYVALPGTSNTGSGHESVSLNGLSAGEYLIKLESPGLNGVSQYSMGINAPGLVASGVDWLDGNRSSGKAHDLGVIASEAWFTGLQIDPSNSDWFQFEAPKFQSSQPGVVHIKIPGVQNVTAELFQYQADGTVGTLLVNATGNGGVDIQYPGNPGQKYFLKLSQPGMASATAYELNFDPVAFSAVNHAPTGSVTITGTATQGQTLTASNTLADADGLGTITYHWLRAGVDTGSVGGNYVLTQADVGKAISVKASYTDGGGTGENVTSTARRWPTPPATNSATRCTATTTARPTCCRAGRATTCTTQGRATAWSRTRAKARISFTPTTASPWVPTSRTSGCQGRRPSTPPATPSTTRSPATARPTSSTAARGPTR